MSKTCRSLYKTCRKSAGFTMEHAAELLVVSVRTLSDYENLRTLPSEDTVVMMAQIYDAPQLVMWHLKNYTPYADFVPDVVELGTPGDAGAMTFIARDMLDGAVQDFKEVYIGNRIVDEVRYNLIIQNIMAVVDQLVSVTTYAKGGMQSGRTKENPAANPVSR